MSAGIPRQDVGIHANQVPDNRHNDATNSIMILSRSASNLTVYSLLRGFVMKHLLGQTFTIADHCYRIVDVRSLGGDALVYAEQERPAGAVGAGVAAGRLPERTAFHYRDIAPFLADAAQA